jgi:PAS domain-containing protein
MEDEVDFELGQQPVEQIDVGDRPRELACDEGRQRPVERGDVQRDDRSPRPRQPGQEAVADFSPGARDQNDRFTHPTVMLHNHPIAKSLDRQISMSDSHRSPAAGDLFQALVEYSSDAIALVDATGKILFLSQTSERLLGYSTASSPIL